MSTPPGPRFVLMQPSHAGNVGAAARAIKVMGFDDLVLVKPRLGEVLQHADALAMASGAAEVLARTRIVDTLDEALDGVTHVCATAMTPRDFGPPVHAPRPYFESLVSGGQKVALLFGRERFGMNNDDVYRCHACISIPAAPDYGSLNLAQAVQVLAYEWRQALGAWPVLPRTQAAALADWPAIEGTIGHWQQALVDLGFLNPAAPKKLMPRLRQLLLRAAPTEAELHILRGIARSVRRACKAGDAPLD